MVNSTAKAKRKELFEKEYLRIQVKEKMIASFEKEIEDTKQNTILSPEEIENKTNFIKDVIDSLEKDIEKSKNILNGSN